MLHKESNKNFDKSWNGEQMKKTTLRIIIFFKQKLRYIGVLD